MRPIRLAPLLPAIVLLVAGCTTAGGGAAGTPDPAAAGPRATPAAAAITPETAEGRSPWLDRGDFTSFVRDGRLWVFERGSAALAEFLRTGGLAESVTGIGVGPAGMSIRASDDETIVAYLAQRDGYFVEVEGSVVWVLEIGSRALADFVRTGETSESFTMVAAGPAGRSLRSVDRETLLEYLTAKPGFVTIGDEGRVWVFRDGSPELEAFRARGGLDERVTLLGAGPMNATLLASDRETILEWMAARPGFAVIADEGRLWVFEEGSEALETFRRDGRLDERVTVIGAGPRNASVQSTDRATILRWMGAAEGFEVHVRGDVLWVFDAGSARAQAFGRGEEPAEPVTRAGAGPMGTRVSSDDADTLRRYLHAIR